MNLRGLNKEQRKAVEFNQGAALVIAGAGTGKTHLITQRIAYLAIEKKIPVDRILALTFTDKAAKEMEERVDRLLPYGADPSIMTFHSFGSRILESYGYDIGLNLKLVLLSKSQQTIFLRQNIDELKLNYYAPVADPGSYLADLAAYFSRLSDELISPEQYLAYIEHLKASPKDDAKQQEVARHQELLQAYKAYQGLKRRAGLIDYSDQITLAIELFERRPNVLEKVRSRTQYLLVDEFQDTNRAQNRLLQMLAGGKGNVMAVGDDDQSIYKFRGAAVENILDFNSTYSDSTKIVLTDNYRSTQEILDSAYRLVQHNNPDRLESLEKINKYLKSKASGKPAQAWVLPTYSLEADAIAEDIAKRLAKGQKPSSIAILVRKRVQGNMLAQALVRHNLPFIINDDLNLFEQPAVRQLLFFVRAVSDPLDSVSLYHLLSSEIHNVDINTLMEQASAARRRNITLEEQLRGSDEPSPQLQGFWEQFDYWRELSKSTTAGQLIFDYCERTGFLKTLTSSSQSDPVAVIAIQNIARLFRLVAEFEKISHDKSVHSLAVTVTDLEAAGEAPESIEPDETEAVQIMTIHQAKGLEFTTVYIFDLTKGTFPSYMRRDSIELPPELINETDDLRVRRHLQEERRLMYVAMTRAKRDLILTYSPDHGGKIIKKPSIFIAEALGKDAPVLPPLKPLEQTALEFGLFRNPNRVVEPWKPPDELILTPHQIDDYLSCPANFHYRHILKVPEPSTPGMMYGSLIHEIINKYHKLRHDGQDVQLELLLSLVEELWDGSGFISKGQEKRRKEQAIKAVERFYERESQAKQMPKLTEKSFEVRLDDIKTTIRGRIDAIYENDSQVEIRDYKTSQIFEDDKADAKAKSSVQLAVYGLTWEILTGKVPTKLSLDFIDSGVVGDFNPSPSDFDAIRAKINEVASGIRRGDFQPSGNCFYCSHSREVVSART